LPLEENLEKEVDFAKLFVEYELKAVMKIKLQFFDWFEEMLKTIVERNNNRISKKKSAVFSKQDDSQSL
jgi:phage regulator Rha-like protein